MIFSVIVTIITQVSLCKQKTGPPSPLTFHFFPHIFSLTIIFRIWQTLMSPRSLTPAAGSVKSSPCPSDAQALFLVCFWFVFVFFVSSIPAALTHCVNLFLSHSLITIYLFWLPHSSHAFRLSCLQNSGHKDCDVQYAELDTAALASSPSPRSSAHTGPGDLVEYATIQPSSH